MFDQTHPSFTLIPPLCFPLFHPTSSVLVFLNPLSTLSAAYMCMCVGPSTGTQISLSGAISLKKTYSPSYTCHEVLTESQWAWGDLILSRSHACSHSHCEFPCEVILSSKHSVSADTYCLLHLLPSATSV